LKVGYNDVITFKVVASWS